MKTVDLALVLGELAARDAGVGPARAAVALPGFDFEVVHLPAGERWDSLSRASEALLVLDGVGTITVDDWRASLGGGHLVSLPAGSKVVALADGARVLSFLVVRDEAGEAAGDSA